MQQLKKRYLDIKHRCGQSGKESSHNCLVYLTPVAGLCIHSSHRWDTYKGPDAFTIRRNNWVIAQYPTGLRAFGDIHTKEMALDIVMRYMAEGFNWVGLTGDDVTKSNDPKAFKKLQEDVNQHIKAANKLINGE